MRYVLYTYHDGGPPIYRMSGEDYDHLSSMGQEWVRLKGCDDYSVETLETG